jgi:glucose-6-phosphate isomerase
LIGIGGSALGPQFVANALSQPGHDKMAIHFFDNTDPDGMQRVISEIGQRLGTTLTIVISKSGGTKETRNGMLEATAAYINAGFKFADHAIAVTQSGSELDRLADQQKWITRFPMWDWVGGRTSQTSAVGLLPAALQGFKIRDLLSGAAACDRITRDATIKGNPAALLAAAWLFATNGKGEKNMVVLPYKDRLELFSKYLQQLIMESIGKRFDRNGADVQQGITVLGNKGATDQHSYIQQLRDGLNDFFAVFIEVLADGPRAPIEVERSTTSGDYLHGFYLGTQSALYGGGRDSITVTISGVSAKSVGMLIALFERTVGLYASLININAYHQPGVEAGKVAAAKVIQLQLAAHELLMRQPGKAFTVADISAKLGPAHNPSDLFKVCLRLASNPSKRISRLGAGPGCEFVFVG